MTRPVYLSQTMGDAVVGDHVTLSGTEAHHAVTVRRTRPGEVVDLIDGNGRRATGTVTDTASGTAAELTVLIETISNEGPAGITLTVVQALAKAGGDEMAVDTATQVGASAIIPWHAERCVSVWKGDKAIRGRDKWAATAQAAAKQARRATIPTVDQLHTTAEVAHYLRQLTEAGGAGLILHETAHQPISAVQLPQATSDAEIAVVVGPEGGITEAELAILTEAGGQPTKLGPHVLRASLAATVALAALNQRLGRW